MVEQGIKTYICIGFNCDMYKYFPYRTRTNRSGGVQGGISNGENIVLRIAFKPTSTIGKEQNTVSREGKGQDQIVLFFFEIRIIIL